MSSLIDRGLPWEELPFDDEDSSACTEEMDNENCQASYGGESGCGSCCHMEDISTLLDQMIMDIQHLEIEVVRARYRLSFHLSPPYDEYLRAEIFSSLGGRYQGDPVYDKYLHYRGFPEYEDAIDTLFHVNRMQRLAKGFDDHPDLYP